MFSRLETFVSILIFLTLTGVPAFSQCENPLVSKELQQLMKLFTNAAGSERAQLAQTFAERLVQTRTRFLAQLGALSESEKNRAWQAWVEALSSHPTLNRSSNDSTNEPAKNPIHSLPRLTDIVKEVLWNEEYRSVAAHFHNGNVKCFGDAERGGSCDLQGIQSVVVAENYFVALNKSGKLSCWGATRSSFDCNHLDNIQSVAATDKAFAALKKDGTIECWGKPSAGGVCPKPKLHNVVSIAASENTFSAITKENTVYRWGGENVRIGFEPDTFQATQINKTFALPDAVTSIVSTRHSFAGINTNGTVRCWGRSEVPSSTCPKMLKGVQKIYSTSSEFYALLKNAELRCWGNESTEHWCSELKDVAAFTTNKFVAMALLKDGSLKCWGIPEWGCVQEVSNLKNVVSILPAGNFFVAETADGTLVKLGERANKPLALYVFEKLEAAIERREATALANEMRRGQHP